MNIFKLKASSSSRSSFDFGSTGNGINCSWTDKLPSGTSTLFRSEENSIDGVSVDHNFLKRKITSVPSDKSVTEASETSEWSKSICSNPSTDLDFKGNVSHSNKSLLETSSSSRLSNDTCDVNVSLGSDHLQFSVDDNVLWNSEEDDFFEIKKDKSKQKSSKNNKDQVDNFSSNKSRVISGNDGISEDSNESIDLLRNDRKCEPSDLVCNFNLLMNEDDIEGIRTKGESVGACNVLVEKNVNLGVSNSNTENYSGGDKSTGDEHLLSSLIGNVKSVEIDSSLDSWIAEVIRNEAFSSVSPDTPEITLEKNLDYLKKTYVELLEKALISLERIPVDLLKRFRGFDPDVFLKLRTTKKRMKALIIRTSNILERKANDQSSSSIGVTPGSRGFFTGEFQPFNIPGSSNCTDTPMPKNAFNRTNEGQPFNAIGNRTVAPEPPKPANTLNTSDTPSITVKHWPQPGPDSSFIDYTDAIYMTPHKGKTHSGKFESNMRNDGATGEFEGFGFPHSKEIQNVLRQKFGLKSFRPNQLQVINAALLGHDCFVLMPTGGGKSLCYQLPAIISKGVTVVISPLRSLILDQVTKMLTLDIPAAHLSGDIKESEAGMVYSKLNQKEPAIKLLYVTPEKVGVSSRLKGCFTGLYNRGMLSRFVIDEVHCVSQWGHDFRPDYKRLKELRENYPGVNIMALTATATPRVRSDILHQLKLENPKWFLSSFNRSNLAYSVKEKKGNSVVKEIAQLIISTYPKETGVIYCFSRRECEDVAKELKIYGVDATAYHAGQSDSERTKVQNLWMNDKVKVVCATIAFGMGVDKLDVRFVIHYSIPKSIEGYYQESGRAGRDGLKASCILYYAHRDKIRMLKLINKDQSSMTLQARKIHVDNLYRVVAFSENKTDCRRALQLEYLGEKFDRSLCISNRSTACDNCLEQGMYVTIDVTEESKAIVSTVKNICENNNRKSNNFTMLHYVDIFKGSTVKKIVNEGHNSLPIYGMGKTWVRIDVERLFRKLIMEEYLKEHLMVKDEEITLAYLKVGRRSEELLRGNVKINFHVKKDDSKKAKSQPGPSAKAAVDPSLLEVQERCYANLMDVIKGIAAALNCNPNAIMNIQAIRLMSQTLPETAEEMLSINHVTEANFDKYGAALLDVTKKFAEERRALVPAAKAPEITASEAGSVWSDFDARTGSGESHYFGNDDIEFVESARTNGKRRKRGMQRWQFAKRAKSASGNPRGVSGRGGRGGRGRAKESSTGSNTFTFPLAKFSTLMELPHKKPNTSARNRLKNL